MSSVASLAMLWSAALACAVFTGHVRAEDDQTAHHSIEVPAGLLEDALSTFARQAGITLSFDPALVRDKSAAAFKGRATIPEGLAALLAPHRLEAVRGDSGAYSVRAAAPLAQPSARKGELPTVTVTEEAERADGPVDGYVARRSATATRTDTLLIETPRAITVVSREQMDDQAVQTVEQSLRYSAGVLTEVDGYDLRRSSLSVRGFAPAEFLDGFRLFTLSSSADWLVEPQGLERVELLKGPGVLFYDGAPPGGGVINMVSKRPRAEAVREVGLSVGNHGHVQANADLGGALDADGRLTWRLNGLLRRSGSQTDLARDDRVFVAPALTWAPTSRTTITLMAAATRDRVTPKSVWPRHALITPNPNGRIPVSRVVGEPGVDRYDRNAALYTFQVEHRLDEHWTLRQKTRYAALDVDALVVGGGAWRGDLRTIDRAVMRWSDRIRTAMLDQQIEGRFHTGPFSHTMLVGADSQRYSGREASGFGGAPPIDAFAPAYGAPVNVPELMHLSAGGGTTLSGLYIQDQVRTGPWSLGLAARHDSSAGRSSPVKKTSYNAGLLHLVGEGLAAYASYSTSFRPSPHTAVLQSAAKPELGRQFELGLKYSPPELDAIFTLSVFDLQKRNVISADPFGTFTQTAGVRTRGPEFEARAALSRRLKLLASYTLLDARVTHSSTPEQWGKQPLDTARRTASLWLDYRFGGPGLQGWSVAMGVRYVDKTPASIDNSRFNPAYTVVDAALRYESGPYSLALNATNLFDRVYTAGQGQVFGQARTLQAKAAYRW